MSPRRWTVGLVGCGRIAGATDIPRSDGPVVTHAQAYTRDSRFQLIAVVDPAVEVRRAFQHTWGIPRGYGSVGELVACERLDVVSLCSPTEYHYAQAVEILTAPNPPKLLFTEKPICTMPHELTRLMALAEQAQVCVIVNHTRRFDRAHRTTAQLIQSGRLGALVHVRCVYYGGWINNGTHVVDTLRLLFSGELQITTATYVPGGRGVDANLLVQGELGAAELRLEGIEETHYKLLEFEFRFEHGRLQLLDAGATITIHEVAMNACGERVLVPAVGFPLQGLVAPMAEAVVAIREYLDGRDRFHELGVDLHTVARTMQTVWQALEMAMSRERVGAGNF